MSAPMKLSLHEINHDDWTPILTTMRSAPRAPVRLWNVYQTDIQTAAQRGWLETREVTVKPGVVETQARFTDLVERRAA